MSNRLDIHSQFSAVKALAPIAGTDDTALVSDVIDTQGTDGIEFIVMAGVLADAAATFDVALYADTAVGMGTEAEVTSADELYGSVSDWTQASDGAIQQFGYRGAKRYLRVKITPTGNASSAPFSVCAIKHLKKVGSTL